MIAYDTKKSKTEIRTNYMLEHEWVGSSEIYGQQIEDLVCLVNIKLDTDRNTCANKFRFIAITETIGFNFPGILGVTPSDYEDNVPSFIQELYES